MTDFDPNFKTTPVLAKIGQKVVVFNEKSEVLFLKRSDKCSRPGGWDFPGGGLDLGEDPLQGISREVAEETQLAVSHIEPVHLESFINEHGEFTVMVGYIAQAPNAIPVLSWEHDSYKWLSQGEALQEKLPTVHKKFLEKALNKLIQ